jgi:pimeloyl-ACP methyl ester carboxylesterase
VLPVDLPGHGLSDKPEIRYTLALFARAVTAVLDDAGVQKAAVVGHSMGGMVAYEFAGRATDIFKKYLPRLLSRL